MALIDGGGRGVLETFLMNGSEATFRELLAGGANPNQTTTYAGVSLLALAQIHGNGGAERALREYGGAMSGSDQERESNGHVLR